MIKALKFVSIPVKEQKKALEFYTDKLGFHVVTDQPMGPGKRWIELGIGNSPTGVVLFTPDGWENRIGTFSGMSFVTDSVEKTYEELRAKGVDFTNKPEKQEWGTMAIFKDIDGNQFVLSSR
ncbi:MAG TPA: VOC family protein [Terriglobales bacterium]|nr:VOC family protein [Terriglobales bacterium]